MVFQKPIRKRVVGVLGGLCCYLIVATSNVYAMALEIDAIPIAQGSNPPCSSPASYFEFQVFPNKTGPYMAANCQSTCQMAAQQEPANANAILAQAKAQNAQINATNAAGSNALQSATANNQLDPQNKVNSLNSLGNGSASQQAQLASAVSQAMRQCAQNIRSKCQSGVDSQDTQIGEQAAKSCEDAANMADQVAADKMAKASEMGQNGNQAGQNGQGMGMPQLPQGGGGQPVSSNPASGSTVNKTAKGSSGLQLDKPSSSFGEPISGEASSITPSGYNASEGSSGASLDSSSSHAGRSITSENSTSGGKALGVSGGSSGGVANSSGQSAMAGEEGSDTKEKKSPLNGLEAKAGDEAIAPEAGGVKPAFIGLNSNSNAADLLGLTASTEIGMSIGGSKGEKTSSSSLANGFLQGSSDDPMISLSLFSRIKTKITAISKQMHMQ